MTRYEMNREDKYQSIAKRYDLIAKALIEIAKILESVSMSLLCDAAQPPDKKF